MSANDADDESRAAAAPPTEPRPGISAARRLRPSPASLLLESTLVFLTASVLCVALFLLAPLVPVVDRNLGLLVAAVFLYLPAAVLLRRGESLDHYGLCLGRLREGIGLPLLLAAVAFVLFLPGFVLYYRALCLAQAAHLPLFQAVAAPCRAFLDTAAHLRLPPGLFASVLGQLFGVALPEEFFFRGYLQGRLEEALPSRRRLFGAPVGRALVLAAAAFALGHLAVEPRLERLAVFFPGLLFGWLRARTGSILAGTLFHALCNLYMDVLQASFFR